MTLEQCITAGGMVNGENLTITSGAVVTCDQTIIAKFRLAGYKPWSTTGTFGASGYSVTASRTVDPQYT